MNTKRKVISVLLMLVLITNVAVIPVRASEVATCYTVEPRYNNISEINLYIGFDSNKVGHCIVSIAPKESCRGFDGILRLYDANGNQLNSWSVSDFEEPFSVQKTWQCESGKTYIIYFQGYAYHNNGGMYDDIVDSNTFTCP